MLMNRFLTILASVFCWAAHGDVQGPLFVPTPAAVGAPESGEIFLVDLNHDGHLDLVTKHLLRQRLAVWSGDGKGHFVPDTEDSTDFDVMPGAVALGDVNNDGVLDLGVSSKAGKKESVRIFLGNRKGRFDLVCRPAAGSGRVR
jgi:hypothetical protein